MDLCLSNFDNQSKHQYNEEDCNNFYEVNRFENQINRNNIDINRSFDSSCKINNDLRKLNSIINNSSPFVNKETDISKFSINFSYNEKTILKICKQENYNLKSLKNENEICSGINISSKDTNKSLEKISNFNKQENIISKTTSLNNDPINSNVLVEKSQKKDLMDNKIIEDFNKKLSTQDETLKYRISRNSQTSLFDKVLDKVLKKNSIKISKNSEKLNLIENKNHIFINRSEKPKKEKSSLKIEKYNFSVLKREDKIMEPKNYPLIEKLLLENSIEKSYNNDPNNGTINTKKINVKDHENTKVFNSKVLNEILTHEKDFSKISNLSSFANDYISDSHKSPSEIDVEKGDKFNFTLKKNKKQTLQINTIDFFITASNKLKETLNKSDNNNLYNNKEEKQAAESNLTNLIKKHHYNDKYLFNYYKLMKNNGHSKKLHKYKNKRKRRNQPTSNHEQIKNSITEILLPEGQFMIDSNTQTPNHISNLKTPKRKINSLKNNKLYMKLKLYQKNNHSLGSIESINFKQNSFKE